MTPPGWKRVTKARPCPVCGHADWCCVREDGTAAVCTRVVEGCARRRDGSPVEWDNGQGWVHDLVAVDTAYRRSRVLHARPVDSAPPPTVDWCGFAAACQQALPGPGLDMLAESLGVSPSSLACLWTGWSGPHGAYTFPMQDAANRFVGIRLRKPDGFKWAVDGSRNGIFHLWKQGGPDDPIVVCEGPTDAAALWDMGFWTIGRAACRTNVDDVCAILGTYRRPCIVVADNDGPGIDGAHAMADRTAAIVPTKVIAPTWAKDVREWFRGGAGRRDLIKLAEQQRLWTPRKDAA